MSGKYVLALFLALQVSMSLCYHDPDQDLVDKYDAMKGVFYKRLLNAYSKLQAVAAPLVEGLGSDSGHGAAAKEYVEDLQTKPAFQTVVKVATGVVQEAVPLVDKARTTALGLYGEYLRPHIGTYLDDAINSIKVVLDKYLPAE